MEKQKNWFSKNKTLVILGLVVVFIIGAYFLFNSKQSVYVCPDGSQVSNQNDCNNNAKQVERQIYEPAEENTPEPTIKYSCNDVDKYITKEQASYGDRGQHLTVILTKVCKADLGDFLRLRVYWKIKNEGTKEISIHPHQSTYVIANSRQYDSDFISYYEKSDDDFSIGKSTGGDLKSGLIAEGGVNVEGIPKSANNITIGLEVSYYDDFQFREIII